MPCIRRLTTFTYTFITLFVFATGCASSELKSVKTPQAEVHGAEIHWGYKGEVGPKTWGKLRPEFALCSEGMSQSPIDISGGAVENLPDIVFNYQPTTLTILNNGHTIHVNYNKGSYVEIDGNGKRKYELKQFHFHTPSEHMVFGKYFALEMHLVHQNAFGELAVVGVLIERGSHNQAFLPIWDNLPKESGKELRLENVTVNANDLLPGKRLYYKYDGSLTTPPCTEGVKWFVLTTPIELSESQIASFKAIFENNSRPVQPLNNRKVLIDASED